MKPTKCFLILALALAVLFPLNVSADPTHVIDTPTTGMLDYGGYNLKFRLFSEGGVLTRLNFGVFKMVNMGFGWEVSRAIGTQDPTVAPPGLYLKIRPFAGDLILPAFAFGYDGQGYFYDRDQSMFRQREKGIFMVIGREIFFPGLTMNIGGNMADFKTNTVNGFANAAVNIEDKFLFLAEYDNIHITYENRLNLGFRFFVNDDLSIDIAGRDIGAAGRVAERVVQINYLGRF